MCLLYVLPYLLEIDVKFAPTLPLLPAATCGALPGPHALELQFGCKQPKPIVSLLLTNRGCQQDVEARDEGVVDCSCQTTPWYHEQVSMGKKPTVGVTEVKEKRHVLYIALFWNF